MKKITLAVESPHIARVKCLLCLGISVQADLLTLNPCSGQLQRSPPWSHGRIIYNFATLTLYCTLSRLQCDQKRLQLTEAAAEDQSHR